MASFNGGILDIPGLMPVNIGSSKPYPVPFAPQIRPQAGASVPTTSNSNPGGQPEVAQPPGLGNVSGFQGPGPDGTSVTMGGGIGGSGIGDAQFATMGMHGFEPGFSNYSSFAPQVHPGQSSSFLGGLPNPFDIFWSSQSNSGPFVVQNNAGASTRDILNAALNAAGLAGFGLPAAINNFGRGISDGFDKSQGDVPAPSPTLGGSQALGNFAYGKGMVGTLGDLLGQGAGGLLNLLGITDPGETPNTYGPMDAKLPPDFSGPSSPQYSGIPTATPQYDPGAQAMIDQITGSNPLMGFTGDAQSGGGASYPPPDPFFSWGGNVPDMGGAGVFNSIGATPWGGMGFGGGGVQYGAAGGSPNADNNGGWGQ